MSLPPLLDGLPGVRAAVVADLGGRLLGPVAGAPAATDRHVAATAAAIAELTRAAGAVGLHRLELLHVRGAASATVAAVRADGFLLVTIDPARPAATVEKALVGWTVPVQAVAAPAHREDGWANLRRAVIRGQLSDAASRSHELAEAPPGPSRPGSEALSPEEREAAVQQLLEGVGSVLAGDAVAGGRQLGVLADGNPRNLSLRWLALHWSARAALKSGAVEVARARAKSAIAVAQQLDDDARAVSHWTGAEVLAQQDRRLALRWIAEARSRFERAGNRWGEGQTWLSEARILASLDRAPESAEAARQAATAQPDWDEPPIFLATQALMRGELGEAEEILRDVATPPAEAVRTVMEAIRKGAVTQPDAREFLREHDAPPTERAIRAMERIATASPRFPRAREALAWMLLKLGKYEHAGIIFRGLQQQELAPAARASVMLGLGCIAGAARTGREPEARLHAAVAASASRAAPAAGPAAAPEGPLAPALPALSASSLLSRGGPGAGNGANAVFSGSLSVFALPDLLEFLRSARRTGLLVCSGVSGVGALRLRDGWITGAAAPRLPSLPDLLLRARKVSALALRALVVPPGGDDPDRRVGELLVEEGLVDAAAVREGLQQQIELAVRELVGWKDGQFAFTCEAGEPVRSELSVQVDPQSVLLQIFKELDEASRPASPVAGGAPSLPR